MKKINQLIDPQNLTTLESSECSEPESKLATPILDRIFAVLTAIYGQKWTSLIIDEQMLEDMQKVWSHHLRKEPVEDIKKALDRLPREYPNWPPTVGQFLELCRIGKEPSLPEFVSLPRPWGDEKIANDAFAELRRMGMIK